MNILVIGQNGREHALAVSYAKPKKVKKVVMTPGNGLTDFPSTSSGSKIKNYPDVGMMDFEKIVEVIKKEKIDLVDVGQDDIIAAGYVDKFEKLGITVFGPTQKASQLEWDKEWAREFMFRHHIRRPAYKSFTDIKIAIEYIKKRPSNVLWFVKAAGLATGKGVIRAENKKQAIDAIRQMPKFGKASETFLIEEGLQGEEFSAFALCDGKDFKVIGYAQDHKRVNDGDQGPNTGGMGCVSNPLVVNENIEAQVEEIFRKVIKGMQSEGNPYKGILYLGGMVVDGLGGQVYVIEFNARWGDPEAEVILPSIKNDYLEIVDAIVSGKLKDLKIEVDEKTRVVVAATAKGYPSNYSSVKDKKVLGIDDARKTGVKIYGAGIKKVDGEYVVNGGRVLYVVGEGENIVEAREKAYNAMKLISIEGDNLHYRTDIGWRDVERISK